MAVEKLWTKDFMSMTIINFFVIMIYFLLMVTIAPYTIEEFNVPASTAGLVSGIFIIGCIIGRFISGRMIQKRGSNNTLLVGLLFFIITTALYYMAINVPFLLCIRFLHGIAAGIASTATGTIIAQIIPQKRKGEGIGYFSMSAILASAIGPFIGIFLMNHAGFSWNLLLNLSLAISSLAIFYMIKDPVHKPSQINEGTQRKRLKLSSFVEPRAIPISFVALVIAFAYSGIMSFLSIYAKEIQLEEAGGYFFLVYAAFVLISRPFTGKWMDQKGPNVVVYPCLILFAFGMLLLSHTNDGVALLVAAALIGLGYGNFISIVQAIAIKVTLPERVGLATSTYFIFYELGLGAGPFILGFIVRLTGYRGVFFAMVFLIVLSILLYYLFHGKKERAMKLS